MNEVKRAALAFADSTVQEETRGRTEIGVANVQRIGSDPERDFYRSVVSKKRCAKTER